MKRTIKKGFELVLALAIMCTMGACGGQSTDFQKMLPGSWYEAGQNNPEFILYDDGTCEIRNEYGTGKWGVVNEDQLKLTNFYGESRTLTILSVESGCVTFENDYQLWDSPQGDVLSEKTPIASESVNEEASEIEMTTEFISSQDYSEGLAWVRYKVGEKIYIGCIDRKGQIQFSYDVTGRNITETTNFSNGFSYINDSETLYVINSAGKITSQYSKTDYVIASFGDGYVVTEEHVSGFDEDYYVYKIFDGSGSVICDSVSEKLAEFAGEDVGQVENIRYLGKGVFGFPVYIDDSWTHVNYFISTGIWKKWGLETGTYFYDNSAATGMWYYSPTEEDPTRADLYYLDYEGKGYVTKLSGELGWNWSSDVAMCEGYCILEEFEDYLVTVKINEGSDDDFYKLDDKYSDKVIWDALPSPLLVNSNRIAIPLRGDDGNRYVAVFDPEWNIIMEPLVANITAPYSDGMLVLDVDGNTVVFDSNGVEVFNLSEAGYTYLSNYSDGVIRVSDGTKVPIYLDKTGTPLFEEVDSTDIVAEILK